MNELSIDPLMHSVRVFTAALLFVIPVSPANALAVTTEQCRNDIAELIESTDTVFAEVDVRGNRSKELNGRLSLAQRSLDRERVRQAATFLKAYQRRIEQLIRQGRLDIAEDLERDLLTAAGDAINCVENIGHIVIPPPADTGTTFTDQSALLAPYERNVLRGNGEGLGGVAWLDYDADGDLDLYLTNDAPYSTALFRNDGDGSFTDVTVEANADVTTGVSGIVAGDIDNDGYPDLFLAGSGGFAGPLQGPTVMLHNRGDGTFADITATAGVPGVETALGAAMADINNDGYLDLFVAGPGHLGIVFEPKAQHEDRLYLNNGDLTFTDITESAGVVGGLGSCVTSFSHYDDDEYIDLFVGVCNDVDMLPTPWHIYRNNGDNTFTDMAPGSGLDALGYWMSSAFGDIDNDGDFDIFATNFGFDPLAATDVPAPHHLFQNNGDGTYTNIATPEMTSEDEFEFGWGASFADFDNDGHQDLFFGGSMAPGFISGNPGHLFMNNGDGTFIEDNAAHGLDLSDRYVTGIAQADFDSNGFADIVIVTAPWLFIDTDGVPILLRNEGNGNNWLNIRLRGTDSNRMGIGARIEVTTANGFQATEVRAGSSLASTETPWPTFGLGKADCADVRVVWPSGRVEYFRGLEPGIAELVEGEGELMGSE